METINQKLTKILNNFNIFEYNKVQCLKTQLKQQLTQYEYYQLNNMVEFLHNFLTCENYDTFLKELWDIDDDDLKPSFKEGVLNIPFYPKIKDNLELNKEITLDYYLNYKGNNLYSDAIEYLETSNPLFELGNDNYLCENGVNTCNTYNYESHLNRVIQFSYIYNILDDNYIFALEVQNGYSDIRVGYSNILFFTCDDIDDFLLNLESCFISISDNENISIYVDESESNIYNRDNNYDEYLNTYELLERLELIEKTHKIEVYL